ncbi:MAG: NAD(P)-dependent alcohol dehydrogenase [Candidatus Thorarchaeota archaeon]|nr:MAG: NAD(P)-dependent alcohol dehydrogenase [Candidatus Thorarchaeota archaeon]
MKAIIWTKYGSPDVLELREIEKPIPKDNELLIKIYATTVTAGDCEMRRMETAIQYRYLMRMYVGFGKPKRITILGMELSGVVESIGKDVTKFKIGDQIFAATGFANAGTYTEYICLPEEPTEGDTVIAIKPVNMSHEEAAPVPIGGLEALYFLRKANIQSGQKLLINGAGGTIGNFAVQIAKYYGTEVTAVDSTGKLEMLHSIGADHVIDYNETDFTQTGETYDVIFDIVGKAPYSGSMESLKENGIYISGIPKTSRSIRGRWTSGRSSKKVIFGTTVLKIEDLIFLRDLIEAGKVKSVIDRVYPLEQTAEAHRYVEAGKKTGHVIITVA